MSLPRSSLNPREKLEKHGVSALSTAELWACVLGQGTKKLSVFAMARVLAKSEFEVSELKEFPLSQRLRVQAVLALAERMAKFSSQVLHSPKDVALLAAPLIDAKQEKIFAWYLSTSGEIVHKEQLAQGTLNAASLAPREVFSALRIQHFDSIVLVHNHPSGNPEPSGADIVFTKRMEAACEIMGVWLRDHVIVAKNGTVSLREKGVVTQLASV
jgi:DNA repair protein RadC